MAVVARPISRTVDLPAEILPYLEVSLHAKVAGYVERVLVDRGSVVKQGDLLVELSAPELAAQIAEAESKAQAVEAERPQAEAQLAAAQSDLRSARRRPPKRRAPWRATKLSRPKNKWKRPRRWCGPGRQAAAAARAAIPPLQEMEAYLQITAPFDGVVTDRLVHPGALVGKGADPVMLVIQQVSRLRAGGCPYRRKTSAASWPGASVPFHVPAFPERTFSGTMARTAHALDPKTRTMPVELDVANRDGSLAPGMYPTVKWPMRRAGNALFVPKTAVVTTTERTFVIRNRDGRAEWVDVKKGAAEGDAVEVSGALKAGDLVVRRATDEIRNGAPLEKK